MNYMLKIHTTLYDGRLKGSGRSELTRSPFIEVPFGLSTSFMEIYLGRSGIRDWKQCIKFRNTPSHCPPRYRHAGLLIWQPVEVLQFRLVPSVELRVGKNSECSCLKE